MVGRARQARGAAPPDPHARTCKNALIFCNRKRDVDILQPLADPARLRRRRAARRHGADQAHRDAGAIQGQRDRACWCAATSPRAASTSGACRTCSISTCRSTPRTTSTASAAPAAPAAKAAPSPSPRPRTGVSSQAIEKLIGQPIPPVSVEGIRQAALSFEEGDGRRSRPQHGRHQAKSAGHAPRHGRGPKPQDRPQPEHKPHAAHSAPQPAPQPAKDSGHGPRPEPRQQQHRAPPGPRPQQPHFTPVTMGASPHPAAPPQTPREDHRPDSGGEGRGVVGFGDHMPAFLTGRGKTARQ